MKAPRFLRTLAPLPEIFAAPGATIIKWPGKDYVDVVQRMDADHPRLALLEASGHLEEVVLTDPWAQRITADYLARGEAARTPSSPPRRRNAIRRGGLKLVLGGA